jgi:hypothetical protein
MMKLPEIRARLFEYVIEDGREVVLLKNEGFVLLAKDTTLEDEQWSGLYNEFGAYICGKSPHNYDLYTYLGEKFGNDNELAVYHALTQPEECGPNCRRQRWLRRMFMRDLGVSREQCSPDTY